MKAIEGVHRRARKLIPALKNNTYKERLSHLKLPSLAHRRRRGDMIYTYKIISSCKPKTTFAPFMADKRSAQFVYEDFSCHIANPPYTAQLFALANQIFL